MMNTDPLYPGSQAAAALPMARPQQQTLADLVKPVPLMDINQTCQDALELIMAYPEAKSFVVCSLSGQPLGLVLNDPFILRLTNSLGMDNLLREPIGRLMRQHMLVKDIATPVADVRAEAERNRPGRYGHYVVVTDGAKVAGVAFLRSPMDTGDR